MLAVKDRVTGHNPLAAIYLASSYYSRLKQPGGNKHNVQDEFREPGPIIQSPLIKYILKQEPKMATKEQIIKLLNEIDIPGMTRSLVEMNVVREINIRESGIESNWLQPD